MEFFEGVVNMGLLEDIRSDFELWCNRFNVEL